MEKKLVDLTGIILVFARSFVFSNFESSNGL